MSSNALESQGMTIARGDGATPTEVFTTIPEVKSISGPDGSANEIDVTDLSSSAKEFRMGLQDEGNITLDMMFIPGTRFTPACGRIAQIARCATSNSRSPIARRPSGRSPPTCRA